MNYYNEYEPFAVEWLKELIKDGLIPAGDVDSRSITEVEPSDLRGYNQCHFFAGIGGWAYAARLAGWADDRPMWTGSPPCQPFSVAGKQQGTDDERHLWPVWFNLVRECKPAIIFGEQVSSAIRHGWLDSLQKDLEAENYACAAAVLPASSVGAFHKRDRLWIVAHAIGNRSQGWIPRWQDTQREVEFGQAGSGSTIRRMADTNCKRQSITGKLREPGSQKSNKKRSNNCSLNDGGINMADSNDIGHQRSETARRETERRAEYTSSDSLADSDHSGQCSDGGSVQQDEWHNTWGSCQAVQCKDGKTRIIPTEPEIFPLANGIPNRMGILRGAGNAIVPQVAAEIIKAFV